ncbi:MAG: type II CRISPR RNA-guided endonuclease Cas9 [Prolixibacteraceae bacterium]
MKRILGLDLGTNSIGWALIDSDENKIMGIGSRIIPMDAAALSNFDNGNSKSQTSERTRVRGVRRLKERHLLRRERLHRVLSLLNFLPPQYKESIDFDKHPGKFKNGTEPKLAWTKNSSDAYDFLFQESFSEMLNEFAVSLPELLKDHKKIPYDWTIYYLRKKALREKIKKEELAWLLLNFNQKRGYYQLRGEEEDENPNKIANFYALKVVSVEPTDEKKGKDIWYNVHLENGWIYRRASSIPLDWEGKTKEFIVTTDLDENGKPKLDRDGNEKRSFRAPNEDDWMLIKKKTEADIIQSNKTIGCYIYDTLLQTPNQKIRGKLVRTVERKFYKDELRAILQKQSEFHPELQNRDLYSACITELYPNNVAYRNSISNNDFTYLLLDDIIFYQRPLKSKKSLISNCPFEERKYLDQDTGEIRTVPVKCIAKSHPLYQEFRLWQFISNLRIYEKERSQDGKLCADVDVTEEFLKDDNDYIALFDWLNERKEIKQDSFLKYPNFGLKKDAARYRWNYVEDKPYPCNETRELMLSRLKKTQNVPNDFLSQDVGEKLWHILYSVEDKHEIETALRKFAARYGLANDFVDNFRKIPPFKKDYGSYSAKALKKLLPLMRAGRYWEEAAIDINTRVRIEKMIDGEFDDTIQDRIREKAKDLNKITDFKLLPVWLACYIVYGRHSEAKETTKWETPNDIDTYLKTFRQHSLRNPIVEQVVTETLRVVRDVWIKYGDISEIHVELGREMKNPAEERRRITEQISENENTNIRIKRLLMEFIDPVYGIDNVRPYSPAQQEILRIFEDGVLNSGVEIPEEISGIIKKFKETDSQKQPSKSDLLRYKLWLEQKYRSPYTNEIIPLGKLFTPAYQIEHIIPQSRFFDDSFSNKVICEAEINQLKDNDLGYEFIKKHHGEKVVLSFGRDVDILSVDAYEKFVKDNYSGNRGKMKRLLMDEIPDQFIERQLNDSRYISRVIKNLLSNVVRESEEAEVTSKHVIPCNGGITDRLKKDWGLNDVWNDIIYPRFERLNQITNSSQFGQWESKDGKQIFQIQIPIEFQKGFSKKRIDHRHHAMDALVIACATRNHISYLNNEAAKPNASGTRYDLRRQLRRIETIQREKVIDGQRVLQSIEVAKEFHKPWPTFTQDAKLALDKLIVSFKQNLRIINKTSNYYQRFDSSGERIVDRQMKGDSWAIRKSMHKDTFFGRVNLKRVREVSLGAALDDVNLIADKKLKSKIQYLTSVGYDKNRIQKYFKENTSSWGKLAKVEVFYFTDELKEKLVAVRKPLDDTFTVKKIEEKVTDAAIRKILLRHLEVYSNDPKAAFSPDGIDKMNRNIRALNDSKYHQPICKVRVAETLGKKFQVGNSGNKNAKFVESDDGTNLFFAIYQTNDDKRTFDTIPLNVAIDRQKRGQNSVPETNRNGDKLLFWLSPNDFVYMPTTGKLPDSSLKEDISMRRIYKIVSFYDNRLYAIPCSIAAMIVDKLEYNLLNKTELTDEKESFKNFCIPLKVDRLGEVAEINGVKLWKESHSSTVGSILI